MRYILLIFSSILVHLVHAQFGPIWAGYNAITRVSESPMKFKSEPHFLLPMSVRISDSLTIKYPIANFYTCLVSNIQNTCDSMVEVTYSSPEFGMGIGNQALTYVLLPEKSILAGHNSPDSLEFFNYFVSSIPYISSYKDVPSLLLKTIYHNPKEPLHASFNIGSKSFIKPYYSDYGYRTLGLLNDVPATVLTNNKTGEVLWKDIAETGIFTVGFEIQDEMAIGGLAKVEYVYSVILDNSIVSYFHYDSLLLNNDGIIEIQADANDTARFEFSLKGEPAEQLSITYNSALTGYGGQLPLINYTKSGDETKVDFRLFIDSINERHLPVSFNFIFTRQVPGEKCINRFFAFTVYNKSTSMNELELNAIKVYPNPSRESVYLSINKELNYEICDLSGLKILEGRTNGEIELSPILDGLYILKLLDSGGHSKSFKLLISNHILH